MLTKFRSAVSKSRRRQRSPDRRHALRRMLRGEPLEGRLLMTGDSWAVPMDLVGNALQRVAADGDGNVYVAGDSTEEGHTEQNNIWLSKYSAGGDLLQRIDFGSAAEALQSIVITPDGVYVAGGFEGTAYFDPKDSMNGSRNSNGSYDAFLAKYDFDLGFQWVKTRGGSGHDILHDVTETENGVLVTGEIVVPLNKRDVRVDMYVAKVPSQGGDVLWDANLPNASGWEVGVFALPSSPATIYIAGGQYSPHPGTPPSAFLWKLAETPERTSAAVTWTVALDANALSSLTRIAVGTDEVGGERVPSVYLSTTDGASGKLMKISNAGDIVWSTSITSQGIVQPLAIAVEGATVFSSGKFHPGNRL